MSIDDLIHEPTGTCDECDGVYCKDDLQDVDGDILCCCCIEEIEKDMAIDAKIDESRGK